jgi:hypothetical protein
MKSINDFVTEMTDNELKEAFIDFSNYNKLGILKDSSIIRTIRQKFVDQVKMDHFDIGCTFTCNLIMFEIAKRHYNII